MAPPLRKRQKRSGKCTEVWTADMFTTVEYKLSGTAGTFSLTIVGEPEALYLLSLKSFITLFIFLPSIIPLTCHRHIDLVTIISIGFLLHVPTL